MLILLEISMLFFINGSVLVIGMPSPQVLYISRWCSNIFAELALLDEEFV